MSERPHASISNALNVDSLIYSKPLTAGFTFVGGIAGTAYGGAVANYLLPPKIEYVEGVDSHSSITFNPGAVVDGRVTEVVSPNALPDSPIPAIDGIHTTVDHLRPNFGDKKLVGEYINVVSGFEDTAKAAVDTIAHHILAGAGIGAALGAGAAYGSVWGLRRIRQSRAETRAEIERLRDNPREPADLASADRQEKQLKNDNRWRVLRTAGAVGALLLVGGLTAKKASEIEAPVRGNGEPLSPLVSDKIPALRGTMIYGGGEQINIGILKVNNLKEDADKTWKAGYANLIPALRNYNHTIGRSYTENPDIRMLTHITDPHCNQANYQYFLGPAMKLINSDIVASTGDVQTNSGTMFFENNCFPGLIKLIRDAGKANGKTVPIVSVSGNHDDKTPRDAGADFFDLTKYDMVKEFKAGDKTDPIGADLTFVGSQDPRSTIKFPTTPVKIEDQLKGLAAQGENIAGRACAEQKAGKTVIAMSHGVQAGFATALNGCATLILNGHSHHEQIVKATLGENGKVVLQHTGGSVSGAHEGFSVYEAPQQDASITNFYYSTSQHQFVGYYTITLNTRGKVKITYGNMPSPAKRSNEVAQMKLFRDQYSVAGTEPPKKSDQDATAKHKLAVVNHG